MKRVTASEREEGDVIYASLNRGRTYHATRECPHVAVGFQVLAIDSPRAREVRREREKCSWCKYDTSDILELD